MTTPPVAPSRKTNPLASSSTSDPSRYRGASPPAANGEARAVERLRPPRVERLPPGAAIALQHRQYRIRVPQRVLDACAPEDAHRPRRLAQQEEAGRVVDLRVRQQDARNRGRADAVDAPRLERLQLLTDVWRGVDEKPRPVVSADRQRRLRARSRTDTSARGFAHAAMAVPLREPSAGGRAENTNAHVAEQARRGLRHAPEAMSRFGRLPAVQVGSDLGAELHDLKRWLDPGHSCLLLGWGLR